KAVVPLLTEALKDRDAVTDPRRGSVCYMALGSLRMLGADAASSVPALIEVVKSSDDMDLCLRAVWVLGKIGRSEKKTVPFLLELLKDDKHDLRIRGSAAGALGDIGLEAE